MSTPPPPLTPPLDEATGPIPEDNLPAHQAPTRRFAFAIDPTMAYFSRLFGVTDDNAWVEVTDSQVVAKFGPWVLRTPRSNVSGATVTGPYAWAKVVGGPRLSFRDRGLTFATSTQRGVCLRFKEPVGDVLPVPFLRHPGLTVTVDDPEGLVEALRS